MIRLLGVIFFVVVLSSANTMQLYTKADGKVYQRVLIPVGSTVIPLDDLPQYKVGVGIGIASPKNRKLSKPKGPIKLITVHSKNKKLVEEKKKLKKKDYYAVAVEEIVNN